jgi:hypothetical protein
MPLCTERMPDRGRPGPDVSESFLARRRPPTRRARVARGTTHAAALRQHGAPPPPLTGIQINTAGFSKSDRPTRCNISARRRSRTVKPTSAPSCVGS